MIHADIDVKCIGMMGWDHWAAKGMLVKGPAGLVAWQKAVWWSLVAIRNIAQQASKRQRLGRMVKKNWKSQDVARWRLASATIDAWKSGDITEVGGWNPMIYDGFNTSQVVLAGFLKHNSTPPGLSVNLMSTF